MSMSPDKKQQSTTPPAAAASSNTTTTASGAETHCSSAPDQHQHIAPSSLNHNNTSSPNKQHNSTPDKQPQASQVATAVAHSTPLKHQPPNRTMAMHNCGPNALQHEQQMKHQQQTSGDTAPWQNNNNNNINNNNNNNLNTNAHVQSTGGNSEHTNDPQQSSTVSNNEHKTTEASPTNQAPNRTMSRSQQQQHHHHHHQLQSQSQQYHGIFSPQIPASLQSSLASRVDQIIRTTLHDSPAYTPPTSKNNLPGNSNNNMTSLAASSNNMPSPTASSSLMFNSTTGPTNNNTSTQQSLTGHPPNPSLGLISTASSVAPNTSIYGSTLPSMSDHNNGTSSNPFAKTSPSHSALAAAAALQSLNQSHIQRSQQQQLAHTQPSPFMTIAASGASPLSTMTKSSSNSAPVPQAAHGGSNLGNHHLAKPMPGSEHHSQLSFPGEHPNGSINFASRLSANNIGNSNSLGNKMPSSVHNLPSWQDQVSQANGLIPRLPPLHGLGNQLPPFTSSSSQQGPYGSMGSQLPSGVGLSGTNSGMIGHDSDSLAKFNPTRSSPGQSNPMQFREEKNFPLSFPTLLSNKQNQQPPPNNPDNLRGPRQGNIHEMLAQERVTEEKLAAFAYNLFSVVVPGKQNIFKKIVQLDDDMKNSIQNGEFYTKYGQLASGILTNQIIVPDFSIIEYLRRDRFPIQEVEQIERLNRNLSVSNLLCLLELVRQRPMMMGKGPGHEPGRPSHFGGDPNPMSAGPGSINFQPDHMSLTNMQHGSPMKSGNFMSSSPTRMLDSLGPQGIDKSRRSSQSPGDISRSQMGNNINNPKLMTTQGLNNNSHQQQGPPSIMTHQFMPPLYSTNQQPHTSPQANRSSPFQPPIGVGPNAMARPPRSHSTIGSLGPAAFNSPYSLATPQVRQPPAAHKNSSRPNLAGLSMDLTMSHSSSPSVPVTAHMSSKTPQTLKLPDTLTRPGLRLPPPPPSIPGLIRPGTNTDPMMVGSMDIQQTGRLDFETMNGLPIQTMMGMRQQDMANRELAMKRSNTPHFMPSNMPGGNQNVDLARNVGMMDNNPNLPVNHGFINNQANNPLGSMGGQMYRSPGQAMMFNPGGMPPPTSDSQRQFVSDLTNRNINFPQGSMPPTSMSNDSQMKQYNALMVAYQQQQQQLMMSGKPGDQPPVAVSMPSMSNQLPAHMMMNQPGAMRLQVGEPMHVDIQQPRQSQSQTSSPKTSQRSIITGSASASGRKSKKAKPSPTLNPQPNEVKPSTSDAPLGVQKGSNLEGAVPTTAPILPNLAKSDPEAPLSFSMPSENPSAQIVNADAQKSDTVLTSEGLQSSDARNASVGNSGSALVVGPHGADALQTTCEPSINASDPTCLDTSEPSVGTTVRSVRNVGDALAKLDDPVVDLKPSNDIAKTTTQSPAVVDQPSKYQKLFTKKAWLKNYDQEDQARVIEEAAVSDEKMAVRTRTQVEEDEASVPAENKTTEDKLNNLSVKTNGSSKKGSGTKTESKKKAKDSKSKKSNSSVVTKSSRASVKGTDNDSEGTNASTSELDDTDETDSMKSSSNKKLRRMPRRKVKSNPERETADLTNSTTKSKSTKEGRDKDIVARKRGKKEKNNSASSDASSPAKRKCHSDDESVKPKTKKIKEETEKDSSPSQKTKKRAGEKFLQTQPCYEIVPKSIRCMECRRVRQSSLKGDKVAHSKQASKTNWDDFCRFFEFRKLRYNKSAQIVVAGFSDANDAKTSDMRQWLPLESAEVPKNITYKVAKFILSNIGDKFCELVLQERSVSRAYETRSGDKRTTWKRAVNGLRELCDVCSTTLFNCHYVCDRCGFVVCIDCHETRSKEVQDADMDEDEAKKDSSEIKTTNENSQNETNDQVAVVNKKSKKDRHGWIFCAKNEEHTDDKLSLAKIIAGDCLEEVWTILHEMRQRLSLGQCSCRLQGKPLSRQLDQIDSKVDIMLERGEAREGSHSTLKGLLLASTNNEDAPDGVINIKQEVTSTDGNSNVLKDCSDDNKVFDFGNEEDSQDDSRQVSAAIEGCIASLAVEGIDDIDCAANTSPIAGISSRLCDGDLLVLNHPRHGRNTQLFRQHWRLGKPVLVRGVHKKMDIDMWLPQFFLGKFGDYRSDLVDCRNGDIHRKSMRNYWDGFEPSSSKKRVKDDALPVHIPTPNNEEPSAVSTSYYSGSALWRLKDWPPGQDFKEILPEHYDDFMNNLPLKSYTTRTGRLNLACRLPKEMLKPDLGPKMYSAYGTTKFPERGTTNLHLDISDAVNVMVYVGGAMPFSQGSSEYSEIYDSTINDCYVDSAMKEQIRKEKLIPGALWHIFRPCDAPKIRDFLNMVADENNYGPDKRIDPIHDQIWYLDQNLLDRLQREYGVKSYPILQCMGDAILIPAGAPHQVKNLQNCIKVANDFVSPENIEYCLQLTDEFRKLPETHINQEDKLQIKNIVYHSVKESIQYIKMFESGKASLSDESSDEDDIEEEAASDLKTTTPPTTTNQPHE